MSTTSIIRQSVSERKSFFQAGLSVLLAAFLLLPSQAGASTIASASDLCLSADRVDLNSTLRGYSDLSGESLVVRLDIPSAGIVSVNVSVPGMAPTEPKIGLASLGCDLTKRGSQPSILERSATHQVLVAEASSTLLFRLASQDPLVALGDFKLTTGFVPRMEASSESVFMKMEEEDEEDPEELEIEPDPLMAPGQPAARSLTEMLDELCRVEETDDHGNSVTCATWLRPGRGIAGEIGNPWGDDTDVFVFVLGGSHGSDLWTVQVATRGETATVGALYDGAGQQIGKSGTADGNLRIDKTLVAGTYYVRVEGSGGDEGPYGLFVDATPW